MKYFNLYVKLIRRAQSRSTPLEYMEHHHIFPKSIFGSNNQTVALSLREHYVAHLLLYKVCVKRYGIVHPHTRKMGMAIHRMIFGSKRVNVVHTSRVYEVARKAVVNAKLGQIRTDMVGKKYFGASEERVRAGIEKMRIKKTGMKINYPTNRKSPPCSDEKKVSISKARQQTKNKFIEMSQEEFDNWISNQSLYGTTGRRNTNVTRAIMWRKEELSKYYG